MLSYSAAVGAAARLGMRRFTFGRVPTRLSLALAHRINTGVRAMSAVGQGRGMYFDALEVVDGVAVVRFDGPQRMNTISFDMQDEAKAMWEKHIAHNNDIRAVVFISGKPDNFIAGADINMLKNTKDFAQLKHNLLEGHKFFEHMKSSGKPLVAAINGACLGGGLEWAMYCDYRIATTNKKTVLGLPEVKLGLLPGFGGTYHLPKLVGYQAALDMILTGKNVYPDKARKMGLVDLVVDSAALEPVAIDLAKQLANKTLKPKKKTKGWFARVLEDTPLRAVMFNQAKKMVDKNAGPHYPSPYKILSILQNNYGAPKQKHIDDEATKFCELAQTPESAALIGIFDASIAAKKSRFGEPERKVQTIAVLGAGLMGAGIAQISVEKGFRVLLKDRDAQAVARGEKYIGDNLSAKLRKKTISPFEFSCATSLVVPLHDESKSWPMHARHADLVIEAVFEELSVKHKVLQVVEDLIPAHAIFASNTSAIPIADIAKGSRRPENVIGMHYFSPVPMMPLVEIIMHKGTSEQAAAIAQDVANRQGKTPIVVQDFPGFYVNRCLGPMVVETYAVIQGGADLETLDKAMKQFGFPVGPITLADEVGIDVANHVFSYLSKADMGVRMTGGDISVLDKMVKAGFLGRKSGKGFFMYSDKKDKGPKKLNPEVLSMVKTMQTGKGVSVDDIQKRISCRFVNEAAKCLEDGIIANPMDGDLGAVFGVGFPPFMGGPFRMMDKQGVTQYVEMMLRYRDQNGEQFQPCDLLVDYAKTNKRFHS